MGESIVVIGGNAAGMTAASRAKRLDPNLEITLLEASPFISYSICGLPYYVSGMVGEHERLISFSPERLRTERGILSRTNVRVDEIYTGRSLVACTDLRSEKSFEIPYRKIVIATGYVPRVPDIDGLRLQNVFTVSRLEDGIRIRNAIKRNKLRRAVIVGGGYIGLMMAHALRTLGLEVLLVERNPHVFNQVDEEIAELIQEELRRNQIDLVLETRVRKLAGLNGAVQAVEVGPEVRPVGLAVIDVGIDPNTALAERSGIPCGMSGAIWVDERGQTRTGGVYAAGNCAQTVSQVSGQPIFSSLGTTAAKQGRVVGENLAGQTSIFRGEPGDLLGKGFPTRCRPHRSDPASGLQSRFRSQLCLRDRSQPGPLLSGRRSHARQIDLRSRRRAYSGRSDRRKRFRSQADRHPGCRPDGQNDGLGAFSAGPCLRTTLRHTVGSPADRRQPGPSPTLKNSFMSGSPPQRQ